MQTVTIDDIDILTVADIAAIRNISMEGPDVRDYNMFMALCRGFHVGNMLGEWTCADACLEITYFDRILQSASPSYAVAVK